MQSKPEGKLSRDTQLSTTEVNLHRISRRLLLIASHLPVPYRVSHWFLCSVPRLLFSLVC
jgi:hypothetical protein